MRATLSNSSFHSLVSQPNNFITHGQLGLEALSVGFSQEALNLRNLSAMSTASLGFTVVRAGLHSLLPAALPGALFLSSAVALFAEVSLYRAVNETEHWQDRQGFTIDLLSFSCLKSFSYFFRSQGFLAQHSISALGMTSGSYAAEAFQLIENRNENFGQRFSHALASSFALECGGMISRLGMGGRIQAFESRLHAQSHFRKLSVSRPEATALPQMSNTSATHSQVLQRIPLTLQRSSGVDACEVGKNEIADPSITRVFHTIIGRDIHTREYFLMPVLNSPSTKDRKTAILNGATEAELSSQTWHKDAAGDWRILRAFEKETIKLGEEFAMGDVRLRIAEDAHGQTLLERLQDQTVTTAGIPPTGAGWIDAPLIRSGRRVELPPIAGSLIRQHLRGAEIRGERFVDQNIAAETWKSYEHSNEDRFFTYRCPKTGKITLAVIDGMGGHAGGARAAVVIRLSLEWATRNGLNIDEALELSHRALARDNWTYGLKRLKPYIDSELANRVRSPVTPAEEARLRQVIFRELIATPDGVTYQAGAVVVIGEFQKNAQNKFDGRVLSLGDAEFHLMAPHLPEAEVVQDWILKPVPIYRPQTDEPFRQRKRRDGSLHPEDFILARLHPNSNIVETSMGGLFRTQIKNLSDIPAGFVLLFSSDGFSENYGHLRELAQIGYKTYQAGKRKASDYLDAFAEDSRIRTQLLRDSNRRKYWSRAPQFPFQTFILTQGAAARAYRRVHGDYPPATWRWTYRSSHREANPLTIWDQEIILCNDRVPIQAAKQDPRGQDVLRQKVISYIKGNDDQTVVVCVLN